MSKKIRAYLDKIKNNEPINLAVFRRLVGKFDFYHSFNPTDIQAKKIIGNLYEVTFINPNLFEALEKIANVDNNRISAATQNLSHSYKTSGSLLFIRRDYDFPQVISIDKNGQYQSLNYNYASELLVVENRELFINPHRTLDFIREYCNHNFNNIDIILGNGCEVANSYHKQFLDRYERIFLLTDIDLGGFLIAKSMFNLLSLDKVVFLYPNDLLLRLQNVSERACKKEVIKAHGIAKQYPVLIPPMNAIIQTNNFLEQESYICNN